MPDSASSLCPYSGLHIISKPEWRIAIPDNDFKAACHIIGNRILTTEITGYSKRRESRKTAELIDRIIPEHIDTDNGFIQLFDLKHSTGFSLASRRNYIRVNSRRKGVIAHIFYNTSMLFNLTIKLGRRLNQLGFTIHIVPNYQDAVLLAAKLLNTPGSLSNQVRIDKLTNPFNSFTAIDYCPVSGLPIRSKPEWTDINCGDGYFLTFKVIGNQILLTIPSGKARENSFKTFISLREKIIKEVFGIDKPYIEIKDYKTVGTPNRKIRNLFLEILENEKDRLAGFIGFNTPIGVRFALNVGKRLMKPHRPIQISADYEQAVTMAVSALDYIKNNPDLKPSMYFTDKPLRTRTISFTPHQIDYYVDEMLSFIGNINWEIDGLDRFIKDIPPKHPFGIVYEAISLIKSDLDTLSRERRKTLMALAKSEGLYRLLAENAMDVIWTADLKKKPLYISPSVYHLTGYTVEEIMSKSFDDIMTQESAIRINQALEERLNLYSSDNLQTDSLLLELELLMENGSLVWTEAKVSFIRDSKGKPVGIIGVTRDISERKKAEIEAFESQSELKKTQAQLIQSEKMAALGNLVAGVSHEISTPLGISVTASTFLQQKALEFQRKRENDLLKPKDIEQFTNIAVESVSLISSNLNRAAELITSFKQISADQSHEEKRLFSVNNYVKNIISSLAPRLKHTSYEVQLMCDKSLVIDSYPGALSQIITNLVMNSLIHGFDGRTTGEIKIRIWKTNGIVHIEYSDNGVGMDEKTLKHVYDPFYTTKRASGGTGLGMNIVYHIVTGKLQGQISCSSTLGEGTMFLIHFPH